MRLFKNAPDWVNAVVAIIGLLLVISGTLVASGASKGASSEKTDQNTRDIGKIWQVLNDPQTGVIANESATRAEMKDLRSTVNENHADSEAHLTRIESKLDSLRK